MTANVKYNLPLNKGDFFETRTRCGSRRRLGRSSP